LFVDAVPWGVAFIKIDKSLTYRGDNSRCIYKNRQNFSEVKNPFTTFSCSY
jgi:hypothetical protein